MRKDRDSDGNSRLKNGLAIEITGGEPFGIVPRDVLRDRELSRSARWLFAVLCTHAGKDGTCRRSLKKIAKDEGATKRSVQKWMFELEVAGRVEKLNDAGKMGVYRVIRDPDKTMKARAANLMRVTQRRMKFAEYGRQGAAAKAEKRACSANGLVNENSPPREAQFTGTGVKHSSPEQDPLRQDPLNSADGVRAAPPDGVAPAEKKDAARKIEDGAVDRAEHVGTEPGMNDQEGAPQVQQRGLGGSRGLGEVIEDHDHHLESPNPGVAGKTNGTAAVERDRRQRDLALLALVAGKDVEPKPTGASHRAALKAVGNMTPEEITAFWAGEAERMEANHAV